jgi:hypothetical protein
MRNNGAGIHSISKKLLIKGESLMGSFNSANKVAYVQGTATLVSDIRRKMTSGMADMKAIASRAQYAAVDRVYNAFATTVNQQDDVFKLALKTDSEILEVLEKDLSIGEAFTQRVKKVIPEIEAEKAKSMDIEKINAVRTGNEVWDDASASALTSACKTIIDARLEVIDRLDEITKKANDPEFAKVYQNIGAAAEEFANSFVAFHNSIMEQLQALNVQLDKEFSAAESAASNMRGSVTTAKTGYAINRPEL